MLVAPLSEWIMTTRLCQDSVISGDGKMERTKLENGDIVEIRIGCIFTLLLFTTHNTGIPARMVLGIVMMAEVAKLPVIFGKFTCVEKLQRKQSNLSRAGYIIPFLND